jgi:hypothetical protein
MSSLPVFCAEKSGGRVALECVLSNGSRAGIANWRDYEHRAGETGTEIRIVSTRASSGPEDLVGNRPDPEPRGRHSAPSPLMCEDC